MSRRADSLAPALSCDLYPQRLRDDVDILVADAGEAYDDRLRAWHRLRHPHRVGDGVRGLERGHDALEPRERLEALERLLVGDRDELEAAGILVIRVLGADTGVVQACRGGGGDSHRPRVCLPQ